MSSTTLTADAAVYSITGQDLAATKAASISLALGSYALTGAANEDIAVTGPPAIDFDLGEYALSGKRALADDITGQDYYETRNLTGRLGERNLAANFRRLNQDMATVIAMLRELQ